MTSSESSLPHTLFVFIDESGNFDFSAKGTRHFVMASIAALSPMKSSAAMQALRYQLLAQGIGVASFHATEDRQDIRNAVFEVIAGLRDINAHVIYGDKRKAAPSLHTAEAFHGLFSTALIRYVSRAYSSADFQQVVVIFDQALTQKQQKAYLSSLKPQLKSLGKPFHIYFQPMSVDLNGQIADYFAWAKFVSLERAEERPWNALAQVGPTEFDIFRRGNTFYY